VAGIIQVPAPARLIEGGLPTERLVADVIVSKFADHLPLLCQITDPGAVRREDRARDARELGRHGGRRTGCHNHLVGKLDTIA